MELKRKQLQTQEIYTMEKDLIQKITALCDDKKEGFASLGYDLELVFGEKENERQYAYKEYNGEETKKFDTGYISHAVFTVKRKKTEEELQKEAEIAENNQKLMETELSDEEKENMENEEQLRIADDANRRSVAFTEMMMIRIYKSFWVEYVSVGDNLDEIAGDLDEFYERLQEKAENE